MKRFLLATLILLTSCQPDIFPELVTQSDGLEVTANITKFGIDFGEDQVALYADVSIANTSNSAKEYSNSWLWLESRDGLSARAYLDSLSSHHIDESPVKVSPNETMELRVYWVFPGDDFEKESEYPFELFLRQEP